MPGAAGWGGSPALPCYGMVIGAAALDSGLVLVQQGVEGVGRPELDAGGFHSGSTSSLSGILWRNALASHKRCRSP